MNLYLATYQANIDVKEFKYSLVELLNNDSLFVESFNQFLKLPSFCEPISYDEKEKEFIVKGVDGFSKSLLTKLPSVSNEVLNQEQVYEWLKKQRVPYFSKSEIYFEYILSSILAQASLADSADKIIFVKTLKPDNIFEEIILSNRLEKISSPRKNGIQINTFKSHTNMDELDLDKIITKHQVLCQVREIFKSLDDVTEFKKFIKNSEGEKMWNFWIDAEKMIVSSDINYHIEKMKIDYSSIGGRWRLSENSHFLELLQQQTLWSQPFILQMQTIACHSLYIYWMPKFVLHNMTTITSKTSGLKAKASQTNYSLLQKLRPQSATVPRSAFHLPPNTSSLKENVKNKNGNNEKSEQIFSMPILEKSKTDLIISSKRKPLTSKTDLIISSERKPLTTRPVKINSTNVSNNAEVSKVSMQAPCKSVLTKTETVNKESGRKSMLESFRSGDSYIDPCLRVETHCDLEFTSIRKPAKIKSASYSKIRRNQYGQIRPIKSASSEQRRRHQASPLKLSPVKINNNRALQAFPDDPKTQDLLDKNTVKNETVSTKINQRKRRDAEATDRYSLVSSAASCETMLNEAVAAATEEEKAIVLSVLKSESKSGRVLRDFIDRSKNMLWKNSLLFWEKCQEFKMLFQDEKYEKERIRRLANELFALHIASWSINFIHLEKLQRRRMYSSLHHDVIDRDIFSIAEDHVLRILVLAWQKVSLEDKSNYKKITKINNTSEADIAQRHPKSFEKEKSLLNVENNDQDKSSSTESGLNNELDLSMIYHNRLQLELFRQFLARNLASIDLHFWNDLVSLKTTLDEELKTQKMADIFRIYLNEKYFFGDNSPADEAERKQIMQFVEEVLTSESDVIVLSDELIQVCENCVKRRLDNKWLPLFLQSEEFLEYQKIIKSENETGVINIKKRTTSKGSETRASPSGEKIKQFRQHLLKPTISRQFVEFTSIRGHNLENDVNFWKEVQKYKELFKSTDDTDTLRHKQDALLECYIDSQVSPSLQVNISREVADRICLKKHQLSPGIFREAEKLIFRSMIGHYDEFFKYRESNKMSEEELLKHLKETRRNAEEATKKDKINEAEKQRKEFISKMALLSRESRLSKEEEEGSFTWLYSNYVSALNRQGAFGFLEMKKITQMKRFMDKFGFDISVEDESQLRFARRESLLCLNQQLIARDKQMQNQLASIQVT